MDIGCILALTDSRADLDIAGGKAASLVRLAAAGLPVPGGFIITTAAYRQFVDFNQLQPGILQDLKGIDFAQPAVLEEASRSIQSRFMQVPIPESIIADISAAYTALAKHEAVVAVRSSATAEDLPGASFAGQQETYLNIQGARAVLEAVRKCWASLWTGRAIGYRARQGIPPGEVSLAVVVQILVPAETAGILFTADPVTGQRDRVLINAAWGLGEAVVGGLVTPDSFTLEKASGRILKREIADKQVMTVRVEGGTAARPVPAALRQVSSLDDNNLAELTHLSVLIENLYGMPMDIEWALARTGEGQASFSILQARPITALPGAKPSAPIVWPLPDLKGQYMRGSIIDFMPDPLTPLFGSLIVPSVTAGLRKLMKSLAGVELEMFFTNLVLINHFPYVSIHYTGRQWLQLIVRLAPALPRLVKLGPSLWRDVGLPRYQEAAARWRSQNLDSLSNPELLAGVQELFQAMADYLTLLQVATLGVAAGSEGVFTSVYDKLIKRKNDSPAPVYLLGLDSIPIRAEKSLFDLAGWCRQQSALAGYLQRTSSVEIAACFSRGQTPDGVDSLFWNEWSQRFMTYLEQYGYSIYNLDFINALPMDEPAPMIETIKHFLAGQGKDPYRRQQEMAERRQEAEHAVLNRVKGLRAWAFRKALNWAQTNLPAREDSIAEIGLVIPLIRRLLAELGVRLSRAGIISAAVDIYWLEWAEIDGLAAALEKGETPPGLQGRVSQRILEWEALKQVTPPTNLPQGKKWLGFDLDKWSGVYTRQGEENVIHGLGASPGQVTGPARVLTGPEDFDQMRPGDVLVAVITTPAWTPLFALALAVITDIGGPLSHGSIVAREYGIPAVLGTGNATHRIRSGQMVTVDGTAGTIRLT